MNSRREVFTFVAVILCYPSLPVLAGSGRLRRRIIPHISHSYADLVARRKALQKLHARREEGTQEERDEQPAEEKEPIEGHAGGHNDCDDDRCSDASIFSEDEDTLVDELMDQAQSEIEKICREMEDTGEVSYDDCFDAVRAFTQDFVRSRRG